MTEYDAGLEPDYWDPDPSKSSHRFALGRLGPKLLIAIGMNPSHANERRSDTTVNRVARASVKLGYSEWLILNLYPERSASPAYLGAFDQSLSDANCAAIESAIERHSASEVLGAWGDPPNDTIRQAKSDVLRTLARMNVSVFYYKSMTLADNPRHPNPRGRKWEVGGPKLTLP